MHLKQWLESAALNVKSGQPSKPAGHVLSQVSQYIILPHGWALRSSDSFYLIEY